MKSERIVNLVQAPNLSIAWARAYLKVSDSRNHCENLTVAFTVSETEDLETPQIRALVDGALALGGMPSCNTVAGTIFPKSLWNPDMPREKLFERYDRAWKQITKCRNNRKGTYFRRMTAYPSTPEGQPINQLEHIISGWKRGLRRNSAFQLSIFDPRHDHTQGKYLGFPCLHQIAITPFGQPRGSGGLGVTGFYATQYLFQKAYGNYLGLQRLGQFIANEVKVPLAAVTCIATDGQLGATPSEPKFASNFKKQLRSCLSDLGIDENE